MMRYALHFDLSSWCAQRSASAKRVLHTLVCCASVSSTVLGQHYPFFVQYTVKTFLVGGHCKGELSAFSNGGCSLCTPRTNIAICINSRR